MSEKFRQYLTESKVARTILDQIRALDKYALPAWGAKDFVSFDKGIQFDVRGSKHRGRVIVGLDKGDLYSIEIGKINRANDWVSIKKNKGIQAANLVTAIDELVG